VTNGVGWVVILTDLKRTLIGQMNIANTDWPNLKIALRAKLQTFLDFLQIYFIFSRFCEFQKLFKKIMAKELLKEGSKGAAVNEGRFVLNIDVLFPLQLL
jgi:hypothetical protein